jgi:hypothetical protein
VTCTFLTHRIQLWRPWNCIWGRPIAKGLSTYNCLSVLKRESQRVPLFLALSLYIAKSFCLTLRLLISAKTIVAKAGLLWALVTLINSKTSSLSWKSVLYQWLIIAKIGVWFGAVYILRVKDIEIQLCFSFSLSAACFVVKSS